MTKNELRTSVKAERLLIKSKTDSDSKIISKLLKLKEYENAETILCYLSLNGEITTDDFITESLKNGKRVAIPYCVDKNGLMEFYLINSLNDTQIGSFNVREPNIKKCKRITDFNNSIIVVPGLCFDVKGYRLGYGKGYYDRFLENYPFISVGLCYNSLIKNKIITDKYDKSVDIIISEDKIIRVNDGGKNG